jgi:hypothetical protein
MTDDLSQKTEAKEAQPKTEVAVATKEEQIKEKAAVIPETTSVIETAEGIAKRIEDGNKKFEELLSRQEAILAKRMLGGRGAAGEPQKTPEEEADEKVKAAVDEAISRFK